LSVTKKCYLDGFTNSVKDCGKSHQSKPEDSLYMGCCKYMLLAYQKIVKEAHGKTTATASLEWIEMLIDTQLRQVSQARRSGRS
jgi:hypothetical protein